MKYRYGDATPFPLDDNFIETLVASVDACVALFHADSAAEERRDRMVAVERECEDELKRLGVLERAVEAAVAPMSPSDTRGARPYQQTAQRIADGAAAAVKVARVSLAKRRDALLKNLQSDELATRVRDAVADLLQSHQLPRSQWTILWAAGQATVARAVAPCGIAASFELAVPAGSLWFAPVPISTFTPGLVLAVPGPKGLLRKSGDRREELHRFVITGVEITPEREVFTVRAKAKKPSPGYRITMRAPEQTTPVVQPIDETGKVVAQALAPSGNAAVALAKLWAAIEGAMYQLLAQRRRMVNAQLGEVDVTSVLDPGAIAEAILSAVAPIVREMRLRSGVPGELVLKRDLGDGLREELFVPRAAIEKKFETLTFAQRSCFEAIGLGGETTREFVSRAFPLAAPPPRPQSAPYAPQKTTRVLEKDRLDKDKRPTISDAA
jgi:hypothetical protein